MSNQKGFSKLAVIIVALILIGGAYFVFNKKDKNIPSQNTENQSNQSNQFSNKNLSSLIQEQETDKEWQLEENRNIFYQLTELCSEKPDKCIFDEYGTPVGIGKLTGYYNKNECDEFVVKSGTEKFIKSFRDWVKQENTVNRIDSQGNLVVNIDLTSVSKKTRDIIVKTNSTNSITLNVFRKIPGERGVGNCYSFINIFSDIWEEDIWEERG